MRIRRFAKIIAEFEDLRHKVTYANYELTANEDRDRFEIVDPAHGNAAVANYDSLEGVRGFLDGIKAITGGRDDEH